MVATLNEERDAEICRRYVAGETIDQLEEAFGISRERVRQILRANNVTKKDRFHVKTGRVNYLGITISEADKATLRAEAERRGVSMSSLTADMIREMLRKTG